MEDSHLIHAIAYAFVHSRFPHCGTDYAARVRALIIEVSSRGLSDDMYRAIERKRAEARGVGPEHQTMNISDRDLGYIDSGRPVNPQRHYLNADEAVPVIDTEVDFNWNWSDEAIERIPDPELRKEEKLSQIDNAPVEKSKRRKILL